MAHLTPAFAEYLGELEANNTRAWFQENRTRYERDVRGPFTDLVAELIYRLKAIEPRIAMEPRDAIFRIARDLRFSREKTPYKPWMAAALVPGGRRNGRAPGFYFAVRWDGVHVGGGMYEPDRDVVPRIRRAIAADGARLARALRGKAYRELFAGELLGERLRRLPAELAAAAAKYPWVANRQWYYYAEYYDPVHVTRPDLAEWLVEHFRAALPLHEFLKDAARRRDDEDERGWRGDAGSPHPTRHRGG